MAWIANQVTLAGAALAIVGVLLAVLVVKKPMVAVLLVSLVQAPAEALNEENFLTAGQLELDPPAIANLGFLIGALIWLVARMREGEKPWKVPLFVPIFIFTAMATVSVVYSVDIFIGVRDVYKISCVFAAYVLIAMVRPTLSQIKGVLIAIVLSSIHPMIIGWLQFANSEGMNFEGQAGLRIQSVFEHPNTYGLFLVAILAAIWGLVPLVGKAGRWFLAFHALACFVALTLPLSRSAWLGAGLIVLFVGWRTRWILVAAVVSSIGVVLAMPRTLERVLDVFASSSGTEDSLSIRLDVWTLGLDLFLQKPVTGFGWGSFSALTEALTHNDYVRAAVELGIVGLIAFLALIFVLLRMTFRDARGRKDLPLATFGFAVAYAIVAAETNSFEKTTYQWYFWVLIGLGAVWARAFSEAHDAETDDQEEAQRPVSP